MARLLVSKVNDIKVIQVGDSKLSIENKSQDGGKVGGGRKIGFVGEGQNKSIDLGKGKRKLVLRLFATSRADTDVLFTLFHERRFCSVYDKFKGRINVYVDSVDITDSDKHVDKTVFDISCTVQDSDIKITRNSAVVLVSATKAMEQDIKDLVVELSKVVDETGGSINLETGVFEFADEALNLLKDGVGRIIDVKTSAYKAYRQVVSRINTVERVVETIKGLKDLPEQLSDLLLSITEQDDDNVNNKVQFRATNKSEVIPIFEPVARGDLLSEFGYDNLSSIEVKEVDRQLIATNITNLVKVLQDVKNILKGGYKDKRDFVLTVDSTIERMRFVGWSTDEVSDNVYNLKMFANEQVYQDIIVIEVSNKSLLEVVFDRYGNLDNLDNICVMNNLSESDLIEGEIEVFK